jgi:hypothetical protein
VSPDESRHSLTSFRVPFDVSFDMPFDMPFGSGSKPADQV